MTAANGRGPFTFEGSVIIRIRNGVAEEGWDYFDFLTLMTQMGAVPADTVATALATAAAQSV